MSTLTYDVRVVSPQEIATTEATAGNPGTVLYGLHVDGKHVSRAEANAAALAGRPVVARRINLLRRG